MPHFELALHTLNTNAKQNLFAFGADMEYKLGINFYNIFKNSYIYVQTLGTSTSSPKAKNNTLILPYSQIQGYYFQVAAYRGEIPKNTHTD